MSLTLSRRAALGAGLATLMPAPPPAHPFATPASVALGLAAATALPASLDAVAAAPEGAARATPDALPNHADLWVRMPLPFTPAQAWRRLAPAAQVEIGAAVIGMVLADYVSGNGHAEADLFLDDGLRDAACDAACALLGGLHTRIDALLPDLFGPDGDHPRWALDSGMAR